MRTSDAAASFEEFVQARSNSLMRTALLLTGQNRPEAEDLLELWDPVTHQVLNAFADVIAAGAYQIAWGICGGCAVHIYDLRTGQTITIGVPARSWAYDGTFSADGRLLAIHLSAGVTPDGRATLSQIGVIDTAGRDLAVLRGSTIGVDRWSLSFGWRGHELVAAVTGAQRLNQIGLWRPGDARMLVQKFMLPPGMALVVGEYG